MTILLTDFGQGEYAGLMKAVIYSIHGDANEKLRVESGMKIAIS